MAATAGKPTAERVLERGARGIELRLSSIDEKKVGQRFLVPVADSASDGLVDHSRIVLVRKSLDLILAIHGFIRLTAFKGYFDAHRLAILKYWRYHIPR